MRPVIAAIAALILVATGWAGARAIGDVPALGPLLDPANGIWAVARRATLEREASAHVPGLGARARVLYDARGVPHIFASSETDAARALGYVVARDRLFQLELQTRAAAGTLTELVGAGALPADSKTRHVGLPWSAERKWAALDTRSASTHAMRAYADGVNAWIDALRPADLPIEYKLLGARPVRWEPVNSVHLINRMGWTLAYQEKDLRRLIAQARVGSAAAEALFPINSPIQEPIQPNGRGAPRVTSERLPPPSQPNRDAEELARAIAHLLLRSPRGSLAAADARSGDALGSNNWVVAPRRTAAGHALLAGDPHLELSLPSIWYEAHIVVPGRLDVYGVTIPGAPWIIIGFNRDLAWTFTNTDADVVDFYRETVDDSLRPTRYLLDESWHPLEARAETYRDRDGAVLRTDTVYLTHRGPMRRDAGHWLSMRWTVLEVSGEHEALRRAGSATRTAEFLDGMTLFGAPPQNAAVADRSGTIAIRSTGRFPVRPNTERGDTIRDGSTSRSDWQAFWPAERYPQAVNPAQGFLASANQQPVDPLDNPDYLGLDWTPPWRAMRINALLRADSAVTPEAMRRYQTDAGSARADVFVPAFLDAARRASAAGRDDQALREATRLLGEWDRRYTKENERAVLFELAMEELSARTWDELEGLMPTSAVLAQLLADSTSPWWDDRRTSGVVERRDAVLTASLEAALASARRQYGEPGPRWRWSEIRRANVIHLLGIPSFSALELPVQGGPSTLSPSDGSGTHGASWRMVVELGPEVRAWGTYPGGQSGNPVSPWYDDRIPTWAKGELEPLLFPRDSTALRVTGGRGLAALTLLPDG